MTPHFLKITIPQFIIGPFALYFLYSTGEYIWLVSTFSFWFLGYVIGEGIFLHRYFSHRTFETRPVIAKFFAFMALLAGFGGPIFYRAVHIGLHHAFADNPGKDPHTPKDGFWHAWIMWASKPIEKLPLIVCKNLLKDKFYVFLETHTIKIWWLSFILLAIIDWRLPIFTLGLSGFIGIQFGGVSNCLSHLYGTRRFNTPDNSKNLAFLSWITWQGSSAMHNNHHANPGRYHDSYLWYEFDIGKWIIPLIATKINNQKF